MKTKFSLNHLVTTMILGFLLIVNTLLAQDFKAFVGEWNGAVSVGKIEIVINCHFELDEESNLTGTIQSPYQDQFELALANIKAEGKKITFDVDDPDVSRKPHFDGMLDETGTKISGDCFQWGGEGTFQLNKNMR